MSDKIKSGNFEVGQTIEHCPYCLKAIRYFPITEVASVDVFEMKQATAANELSHIDYVNHKMKKGKMSKKKVKKKPKKKN